MIRLFDFLAMFHLFQIIEAVKRKRETGLISQPRLAPLTKKAMNSRSHRSFMAYMFM
jgi:hypothetical protein